MQTYTLSPGDACCEAAFLGKTLRSTRILEQSFQLGCKWRGHGLSVVGSSLTYAGALSAELPAFQAELLIWNGETAYSQHPAERGLHPGSKHIAH